MDKDLEKAVEITKQVREYAKGFIKKNMLLLEIAEKIEGKIIELGGKSAFPTGLGINDIAAHSTPAHTDETKAEGLLKVDFGVRVGEQITDNAFSLDLTENKEHIELIKTSEAALQAAIEQIKKDATLGEIGKAVQETAESAGLSPIINLSGHEIAEGDLHAGLTIPNHDNKSTQKLNNGIFAIEPFVTKGLGKVYDGKPSGIYRYQETKAIRSPKAREILKFIEEEYLILPFCSRWIVKKFGTTALIALKQLEQAEILHHYNQLIEESHSPVAQAETTILKEDGKVTVLI